ncbi:MAG: transporter substrate-binding domain-containing protein [Comamonas sp.]
MAVPVAASTLETVRSTGVLRIGYWIAVPFSYRDESRGVVTGYSIEICKRIAEGLKAQLGLARLDIHYVPITASSRVRMLDAGAYDIECSASTQTAERQRSVLFSRPYFYVVPHYVALARHGWRTLDDLRGHSVSVLRGSVNIARIGRLGRERRLNLSIIPVDSLQEAFDAVTQERASAAVLDDALIRALIARSGQPEAYAVSADPLDVPEPYGLMTRLDDQAFAAAVDAALGSVLAAPDMAALYARWFMQPIAGLNINLSMPMSPALRQALAGGP